jgi:hypothetical protein
MSALVQALVLAPVPDLDAAGLVKDVDRPPCSPRSAGRRRSQGVWLARRLTRSDRAADGAPLSLHPLIAGLR